MHGYGSLRRRFVRFEDRLVNHYFQTYGTVVAFGAYAFVFGYYGFLKVQALFTGLTTPVRGEVGALVSTIGLADLGISLTMVMVFIGVFEMGIGVLFALRRIRLLIPLFLVHMAGTFATLVIARAHYFQEPFIGGVPWLFDSFAAYILKNTIFVGGFLVLAAVELGHDRPARATNGPEMAAVE